MNSTQDTETMLGLRADLSRLSRENAAMREALLAFVSAQQTNDRGEYAGWRISGRGSVNEAAERARAALTQIDAPPAEEAHSKASEP